MITIAAAHIAVLSANACGNDNAHPPMVGDRVERVSMCCEGGLDDVGIIVTALTNQWGTSWEIRFANGSTEWASRIAPPGSRGAGYRFA